MSVVCKDGALEVVNGVPDISKDEFAEMMEDRTKLKALKTAIEKSFKLSWHDGNRLELESSNLITNAYLVFWPEEYGDIVQKLKDKKEEKPE